MKWITALLRVALRLGPADWREEFGPEIQADFEQGIREARAQGRFRSFRFIARMLVDSAWSSLMGRCESLPFRYAWRGLLRSPTFITVAVLALALGIGANTAVFSVVNAVLLSPLPYERTEDLVRIWSSWTQFPRGGVSEPEYYDYLTRSRSLEGIAAFIFPHDATLAVESGEPEPVKRTFVTASLFQVLGVEAFLGRTFHEEENDPEKGDVVILSHGLWQRTFGSDPGIVGKTIRIQAKPHVVVGVMPAWFRYPEATVDLWLPLPMNEKDPRGRGAHFMRVVARKTKGAPFESVRADLDLIGRALQQEFPDYYPKDAGFGVLVLPMAEDLVADVKPALLILLGAVGFVLLIACANVANLLLARAAGRERELAVRKALGASQWRLIRQLLAESLLLSLLSGALAVLLAHWMISALVALAPGDVPRLDQSGIDFRVLSFTLLVSVATGVLFGTLPAWRASRAQLSTVLSAGATRSIGVDRRRTQRALLVSEVALAVLLLVGAGLLLRSFAHLLRVEPGFLTEGLVTARLSLPRESYPEQSSQAAFFEELCRNIERLPGVEGTALVSNAPFSGFNNDYTFYVEGMETESPYSGSEEYRSVSPGYFRVLGIPLLAGREFERSDDAAAPPVVVVSESFARKYWEDEVPIGKRIKIGDRESDSPWVTVVGVAGDVRHAGLASAVLPMYYQPHLQQIEETTLLVRTRSDPESVFPLLRAEVRRLDPDLAVFGIEPMDTKVATSIAQPRFHVALLGVFALLALTLAAIGIYGLARYAVTQRTSEIGLRVALGATRGEVLRLVLGEGVRTAGIGLVLGLLASAAMARGLAAVPGLLHGVSALDLPTYGGVAILLMAVVLTASLAPASRASRIAPVEALRYE